MESPADNLAPTLTLLHNDLTRLEFISQKHRQRKGVNTKRFSTRKSSVPKVFPEHDLSSVTRNQFVNSSAKSMTKCTFNHNKKESGWQLSKRHRSPTLRLRGTPKRHTEIPCTIKSCNNSASEAFTDNKMACRLVRSKHVLRGKEFIHRAYQEAEEKNGVLSLKNDPSWKSVDKKPNVDEPAGNAKCELFHQLLSECVSSNSIPTLPKLSADLSESTMQAIHNKNLNQSSKENLAGGRWHNWMKTKYEPSFDFAKDRKAAPLLGPSYSGVNVNSCSSDSDSSRPSSSLRAGQLYSSCFPLLVKNYSQTKVHRHFPRRKEFYKNVPTSQRDDTSGKSPECSEKDDVSYCSARCCCDTFNCSNSCEAVNQSSLNLDSRSLKSDALQQCGVTETEDMPFASRKLHRVPKASKDSRKLQKRHMASKVASKHTNSRTVCLEQQDIVNCSNVWKSILKSRDLKKSEVKSQYTVGAERNDNSSTISFESEKKRKSEDLEIEPPTEGDFQSKEDSQPCEREQKMGGKSSTALSTLCLESNGHQFKDLGSKNLKRNRRTFRFARNYVQRYPQERDEIFFPFYRMLPQCTETPAAGGTWQTSQDSSNDLHKEPEGIEKEDIPSCNEDKEEQAEDTHNKRHTNDTTDNNVGISMNIAEHGRTTCGKTSCDESQSEFFQTRRSSDDEDVDDNSREMTEQHSTSCRLQTTNHDLAQEEVPDSLRWNCRVKGYEIIRHLVRGSPNSFSKLFLASNTYNPSYSLVEIISYKQPFTNILTSFYCNDTTALQRHRMRERSLAITLHKNLVTLLHRFCTEHMVYQVTEHIPWPTLTHLISTSFTGWVGALRKGLSENTRRGIFKQICHGIEHLHLLGTVHGGLNCNNVLVSDKLEVKLTDYGPACQRLALTYDPLRNRMLTRGNPYDSYTPPEMMSVTGSWTRSCDVWCIGIALLEMTLGVIPPSLIRTIRLNGNAKKIDKVNLENCGYQLSLLIDKILQSRPSQRPHVSALTHHAWLSDGTELALEINHDAKKVSKRTDGSTFPLPKRLQNQSIPTSEAFYDSSDSESSIPVVENPVNCEDYQDGTTLTCAEKSCVCNECGWTMDMNPCGSLHSGSCIHSESITSFELDDKTSSESLGSGEDPNHRVASEGKAVAGFLSTLVASLDSSSRSNIESRSLTRVLKPNDKPWLRRGLVTGIPPQQNHSKKVHLSSYSPSLPSHRRKSPRTTLSKSERFCSDSSWTKVFQSYLDSGDHKSNSFNYPNDDTPMTASTDCNDEFVLEGDDEALEEIENLIQQEEQMFWGREFGKISQEAA